MSKIQGMSFFDRYLSLWAQVVITIVQNHFQVSIGGNARINNDQGFFLAEKDVLMHSLPIIPSSVLLSAMFPSKIEE